MTAEEYIKAYTRGCSNELVGGGYHEWLTPENALAAVELAREEMMKDAIDATIDIIYGRLSWSAELVFDSEQLRELVKDKYEQDDKVKVIIIKE